MAYNFFLEIFSIPRNLIWDPQYDSAYHLQTYIYAPKLSFWQPHPIFEFERIVIVIIIAKPTR